MISRLSFLLESLFDRSVGSLMPTSPDAVDAVCRHINFKMAETIIEYGPGNGAFTKEFLSRMSDNGSRLLVVEKNAKFARNLMAKYGNDHRLAVHIGCAEDIAHITDEAKIRAAQFIVSGIPFSRISGEVVLRILHNSANLIGESGMLLCYQFRDTIRQYLQAVFSRVVTDAPTPWNLRHLQPPLRIYKASHPHSRSLQREI